MIAARKEETLSYLHHELFQKRGSRIRIADLGDKFPDTQISAEAFDLGDSDAIQKVYDEMEAELSDLADAAKNDGTMNPLSEPLNLRIKDIDIDNSRLTIREAKRNKDRVVSLPCSLLPEIQEQIKRARKFYELDAVDKIPVPLPGLLAKKYPSAPYAWQWYWLFPSAKTCAHPRTGETVRWRVHEANVQKCVRESARKAGLDGAVTPHNLRHSYASHLIERGVNIKSLAEAMGHSSILTTSGYCHTDALSVPSPLSSLSVLGPVSGG